MGDEIRSAEPSNKRVKDTPIDRLSALPDSLLIHILSFLDLEEAATTVVLSKRWQFLWADLPRLEFSECSNRTEKIRQFVAWIQRALVMRSGKNLEKFQVGFTYDECFVSDVNLWMDFCVKNKVKDVGLLLDSEKASYMLPQIMYSNSSLARLSVGGCVIAPRRAVEWGCLTTLHLEEVKLSQDVFENILSGCPVLSNLILTDCWGLDRLDVNSRSLVELRIFGWGDENVESLLEISAPYINYLVIIMWCEGKKLRLTNISSLVSIDINCVGFLDASAVEVSGYVKELFENLGHVKKLVLRCDCTKYLSLLVMNGLRLPQSRREHLIVNAYGYRNNLNVVGIVDLLESSPDIETLVVNGSYDTVEGSDGQLGWYLKKPDLNCDLLHLKTVDITSFANYAGEPMLTLAQILLKRAMVLEKMVIHVIGVSVSSSDYIKMAEKLLSYPRASQKAVVLFCQ